jgi:hypothetical protein
LDATILNSASNSVNSSVSWLFFQAIPYSSECASVSSTIAHIRVNCLDDIWLSCLDLDKHEFEFMDATMFKPHGWKFGARLSDCTEGVISSVVSDADSEYVMLIHTRSVLFSKRSGLCKKRLFQGWPQLKSGSLFFCADTFRHRFLHMLNPLVKQSYASDAFKYRLSAPQKCQNFGQLSCLITFHSCTLMQI